MSGAMSASVSYTNWTVQPLCTLTSIVPCTCMLQNVITSSGYSKYRTISYDTLTSSKSCKSCILQQTDWVHHLIHIYSLPQSHLWLWCQPKYCQWQSNGKIKVLITPTSRQVPLHAELVYNGNDNSLVRIFPWVLKHWHYFLYQEYATSSTRSMLRVHA